MAENAERMGLTVDELDKQLAREVLPYICLAIGCEPSRIKSISFEPSDEVFRGAAGMRIEADPPLTEAEHDRIFDMVRFISKVMGGHPPIKPGQA